jgi:hypothetical protein
MLPLQHPSEKLADGSARLARPRPTMPRCFGLGQGPSPQNAYIALFVVQSQPNETGVPAAPFANCGV